MVSSQRSLTEQHSMLTDRHGSVADPLAEPC
jgi:hypothetical protein